jgi:hypothetical protein
MSIKLKRILLLIGIVTGLTVLTLLFSGKDLSGNDSRSSEISQSFFQVSVHKTVSGIFNQTIKIFNNQ